MGENGDVDDVTQQKSSLCLRDRARERGGCSPRGAGLSDDHTEAGGRFVGYVEQPQAISQPSQCTSA